MSDWDECAATWDSDEMVQQYCGKAFNSLNGIVDVSKVESLLDFGSGTGLLTCKLAPTCNRIVAIDPSKAMIDVLTAKNLPNVAAIGDFLTADLIANTPCLQEKFDLIVASSVCSFLPNYAETVALLYSLLKPNGHFVQWDWQSEAFSKAYVETTLTTTGFSDVRILEPFSFAGENEEEVAVLMAVGSA